MIALVSVVLLWTLVSISVGQQHQKSSKDAAILSEARYLTGNGQFGSAYSQEDGVEFKEESDGAGNRRGSYSYVDPTGKRRTVTYTAGKDGFRATGDHIPVPPVPVVPAVPSAPTSQYDDSGDDWKDNTDQRDKDYQNDYNNNQYDDVPQQNPIRYQNPVENNPSPTRFQYQSPSFPSYSSNYNPSPIEPVRKTYPSGKINLNRSPDGFSYTFNSV